MTKEARFPAEAGAIAERLLRMRKGEVLEEERGLAGAGTEVLEPRLRALGTLREGARFYDLAVEEPDRALLRDAALRVARDEARLASGERDRFVAQAVRAVEELDKSLNALVERAREWYGLHFPEALDELPDPQRFVEVLAEGAERERVAAALRPEARSGSIGVDFRPEETAAVQGFAAGLRELFRERARLERLVVDTAAQAAPNLSELVGGLIAAKLIARAGSLERLAFLPASTVQTLGAETSLFQHLKEGTLPPKHGVLFQHGLVNTAPRWQRGRLARVLAAHALVAARFDHFRGARAPELDAWKARLEAQAKRIQTSKPPGAGPEKVQRARAGPPPRAKRPVARRAR